jgi:large conductance mechanosensitive channel
MWNEFKAFVMRGNVVDMAVGVILGTAFGKIVTSLVSDIVTPPIGLLLSEVDFSNLFINLSRMPYASLAQAKAAGAATINYGVFVNDVINFLIVAMVMFWLIKPINRWKGIRAAAAEPAMKECPYCLSQIPIKAVRCTQCTATLTP